MEKLPDVAKLPSNKTVVEVLGHFLSYLFSCAHRFICETHGSGDTLWQSVEHQMDFVLSHPNGWGGLQQGKMRQAAVLGGLVPDTAAGHDRVHFVTEGEASLHFCIQSGLTTETLRVRYRLLFPSPVLMIRSHRTEKASRSSIPAVERWTSVAIDSYPSLLQRSRRLRHQTVEYYYLTKTLQPNSSIPLP